MRCGPSTKLRHQQLKNSSGQSAASQPWDLTLDATFSASTVVICLPVNGMRRNNILDWCLGLTLLRLLANLRFFTIYSGLVSAQSLALVYFNALFATYGSCRCLLL
jgi:hypothetical protein